MDWKVLLSTFGVIFLAEMGDKTQLAAMTLAADTKRPVAVFVGAAVDDVDVAQPPRRQHAAEAAALQSQLPGCDERDPQPAR